MTELADACTSDSISWFGPLSVVFVVATLAVCISLARRRKLIPAEVVLATAPVVWLLILSASIAYDPWRGRFFVFPIALSAALWGPVLQRRAIAAGCVAIAATTSLLCFVHFLEKPSGLRLLEHATAPSVWGQPRWRVQSGARSEMALILRYLETEVPHSANIALALGTDDWGYPPFGSRLSRTVTLVAADEKPTLAKFGWLVISPSHRINATVACWRVVLRTASKRYWRILHRINNQC